jgi:hypothetical protein
MIFSRFAAILILAGLGAALSASAATVKLYLKDGTYQLAREYKVENDRVRFYSTDRGEWEEVPLALIDLGRTEREVKEREESVKEESAAVAAEEKAEREARREMERVPVEAGAYRVEGDAVKPLKVGESKIVNNKRRSVLKLMSPLPIVNGKQTLELDGLHSPTLVTTPRPEFYIRLSTDERFGMVRMSEHKGNRVVEQITVVSVSNEIVEEPRMVPVFRKQVAEGLYRIWPEKDLEPGEYGVVEYTEGKVNVQVWDFRFEPKP